MKKILLTLVLLFSFTSAYADNCDEKNFDLAACLLDAEQGRAEAQHTIGMLYAGGWGVAQDSKEAVKWFILAAEQGHVNSQFSLGMLYWKGKGIGGRVAKDFVKAHLYLSLSAANGNQYAVANREELVKKMMPFQIETAEKLAIQWAESHP